MILILLFSFFIYCLNAHIIKNDCFEIEENYDINQTTLQIKGNGRMCDCNGNELKEYRNSITSIRFED